MSTVAQRPPIYKYVDYQAITSIDGLDQSVRNLASTIRDMRRTWLVCERC